jgi:exonuclease VII small subunit
MYDTTEPYADEMATEELEAATEALDTALTLVEEATKAKAKAKKAYKEAKKRARKTRPKRDVVPLKKIEKQRPHSRQVSDRPVTRSGVCYGCPPQPRWLSGPKEHRHYTRSNPRYLQKRDTVEHEGKSQRTSL